MDLFRASSHNLIVSCIFSQSCISINYQGTRSLWSHHASNAATFTVTSCSAAYCLADWTFSRSYALSCACSIKQRTLNDICLQSWHWRILALQGQNCLRWPIWVSSLCPPSRLFCAIHPTRGHAGTASCNPIERAQAQPNTTHTTHRCFCPVSGLPQFHSAISSLHYFTQSGPLI